MESKSPLTLPLAGTHLLEASAGTGKTHTITWLVLRLLLERGLGLDQILVVTFTQAATAELRTRVRHRLHEAAQVLRGSREGHDPLLVEWLLSRPQPSSDAASLQTALGMMDEAPIFTIHGFCQRVLEECAFESGERFDLELLAETDSLLLEAVQDFWGREMHAARPDRVRHLAERGIHLAWLLELGRLVTEWPTLRVVPSAPRVHPEQAMREFLAARDRVARAWPAARDEVMTLLRSSPALRRNAYRRPSLEQWQAELDTMLAQTEPSTARTAPNLARFTRHGVRLGTKKGAAPPSHPFFDLCGTLQDALGHAERELEAWRLGFLMEFVTHVRHELRRKKQTLGVRSFADLLEQLAGALAGSQRGALARRIRQRHPAAVVDEFQDTDPVQHRVLSSVYSTPDSTLLMIGDPKQAIYGFRGADVFAYLDAARSVGEGCTWTLSTNYRSDPGLIRAINQLFGELPAPFLYPQIRYHPVTPRPGAADGLFRGGMPLPAFELAWVPRRDRTGARGQFIPKRWAEAELPSLVAAQLVELLESVVLADGQPIQPGHIAILTRTNRQAEAMARALRSVGVPGVLFAQSSVLDSPEAREMALLLRALATPSHAKALRTALATPLFALNGEAILAFDAEESAWQTWLERFQSWHDRWQKRGFIQALRRCFKDARIPPRLLARPGGERKLTNLFHLGELLHAAQTSCHLGMAGLLRWFEQVRNDPSAREEVAAEARQIRLETDEQAVMLVTLHKSKGLEYPIVLCPYLWDGTTLRKRERQMLRYHELDAGSELVLDLSDPESDQKAAALAAAEREALAEQLRLVYVALTRAKHRVSVVTGAFNTYDQSALAYLLHHPRPTRAVVPTEAISARVRGEDDEGLVADLRIFAERAGPTVEVRSVEPTARAPWQPPRSPARDLECRVAKRSLSHVWRSSSFTGLTARSTDFWGGDESPGRDELEPGEPGGGKSERSSPISASAFADLPRGPEVGTLVHAVLEHADFAPPHDLERLVSEELARRPEVRGIDARTLAQALAEALTTPLGGTETLRLAEIGAAQCLKELEFLLPVHGTLTPGGLARVLARRAEHPVPDDYAERVAELGFAAFSGYLRGYIDLVFEYRGRYFIVDYKTNHLGDYAEDYAADRLATAMAEHHYLLQYHLYTVALDRLLRLRVPGYDYDRHFGGVYYVFLRGMSAARHDGHGVFFDRPPRELVMALGQELQDPSGAQGAA